MQQNIFSAYNNNEFEGAAQGKRESNQSEDDDFVLSRAQFWFFLFPKKNWVLGGLPRFSNRAMPRKFSK